MPNIRKHLVAALIGGMAVLTGLSELAPTNSDGRVLFKKIKSTDYVVLEEKDPTVKGLVESTNNIVMGKNSTANRLSVAIGATLNETPNTNHGLSWSSNYIGNVEVDDRSVAIGPAAKAKEMVSVAIGNMANVHGLHSDPGEDYTYSNKVCEVTTTSGEGMQTTSTTNQIGWRTYTVKRGLYERLPYQTGGWDVKSTHTTTRDGVTTKVQEIEEATSCLWDMSYMSRQEEEMYDRIIGSGQGDVNLKTALYGVAVGSRAYVFGYHGVAYGHYAHVSRPWGVAIGSESHVYSEGSMGVGYDTDIATNSPYSMAIGLNATVPSGMTNAIVIGMGDATKKSGSSSTQRPTAVKSNSINLVFHGNGLEDMYLDGVSMKERIGAEVEVVGSSVGTASEIKNGIEHATGLDKDNDNIVLWSGDGIRLYTSDYTDEMSSDKRGSLEKVFINDVPLSEIISSSSSGSSNPELEAYRTTVKNAASEALTGLNSASNLGEIKEAMKSFLDAIK